MGRLELHLLGVFKATLDGKLITSFETDKVRALLAYLMVESDRPHRREQLAALLWPGWPDASARTSLRNALSNLRKAIGDESADPPFLLISRETIQFNPASDFSLDTLDLERLAKDSHATAEMLQPTLERVRSSFLEGFTLKDCPAFDDWSLVVREQLQTQVSSLLSRLAELYEKDKLYEKAIVCTRQRLSLEPWQEDDHRQLMRLLTGMGQRSAALEQFEVCKRALKKELGVEPAPETVHLFEYIRDSQSAEPMPAQPEPHPNNLPTQLTSFIGREKEIAEIKHLFGHTRLLTLTGAGGTGKTRLALEGARGMLAQFPDGVWLAELASLNDPNLVVEIVARSVGMQLASSPQALSFLEDYLRSKNLLLVLDNCEHLIQACAQLAHALLQTCPSVVILASSREALEIEGETAYRVPSLPFPGMEEQPSLENLEQFAAIRLFVDRARSVSPDFQTTHENAPFLAHICRRLDGIPLAIELAAARLKVLSVEEIDRRLDDRFRLLTGGSRAALPRHRTLQASLDWSYELLSPTERTLLQRLSTFADGWFLEAAEQVVCGEGIEACDVLDLLEELVDKSLVVVEKGAGSATHYRMLETIRQYADEKLVESGQKDWAVERYIQYYGMLAENLENKLRGPQQVDIMRRLDDELENIRKALDWCLGARHKPDWSSEPGLRLACALGFFWNSRSLHYEAFRWLDQLLVVEAEERIKKPATNAQLILRAYASAVAGSFAYVINETDRATEYSQESKTLYGRLGANGKPGIAFPLRNLGVIARRRGDLLEAKDLLEESLSIFKEAGDRFNEGECKFWLGHIASSQGDYSKACQLYQENLSFRKEIGDLDGEGFMYVCLGWLAFDQFEFEKARVLQEKSLRIGLQIGNTHISGYAKRALGLIDWLEGKYDQAEKKFTEDLPTEYYLKNDISSLYRVDLSILGNLGEIALGQGDFKKATKYFDDYLKICQEKRRDLTPYALLDLGILALAEGNTNQAITKFANILELSRKNGDSRLETIAVYHLGKAEHKQGDVVSARSRFLEVIEKRPVNWDIELALDALAICLIDQQQLEVSARLLGAIASWHQRIKFQRTAFEQKDREIAINYIQQALGEEAFAAAWEEGKAMTLEQAIQYARDETV